MNKQQLTSVVTIVLSIIFGTGLAYAVFVSNTISISNNTITAGEAAIKFCDTVDANKWTTAMNPVTTLAGMIPGESRDVYAGRNIYIGNDGGQLTSLLGSNLCNGYLATASASNTSLKITPTLQISAESCPTAMADTTLLKLELGSEAVTKTVSQWVANSSPFEQVFTPNSTLHFQATASYDQAATTQAVGCSFVLHFSGSQVL